MRDVYSIIEAGASMPKDESLLIRHPKVHPSSEGWITMEAIKMKGENIRCDNRMLPNPGWNCRKIFKLPFGLIN